MIDAFAAGPFRGNQACVVEPLDAFPDAAWMQALAAENNQAETAFLVPDGEAGRYHLRWFTPAVEVPLCGHATLAAAHALFAEMGVAGERLVFDTASGPLRVERADGGYRMDFPADPPQRLAAAPGLAEALGVAPVEIWAGAYLIAVLVDESTVRSLKPRIALLPDIVQAAAGGRGDVGVTARAEDGAAYDVVSRFFAPGAGIDEDPATGSLHTILSPLWSAKLGRASLRFHQAYPGRGGDLVCEHRGERVILTGRAVTVLEGRLRVSP
jgi:PhzF family phenazine biosynthesis protein